MSPQPSAADVEFDRLMALLDVGIDAARRGDGDVAIMAAEQALKAAERLPKRSPAICLPDLSQDAPA